MIGAGHGKPNFVPAEHTRQNRSLGRRNRRLTGRVFPDPRNTRILLRLQVQEGRGFQA
jgi:hypothetical protein